MKILESGQFKQELRDISLRIKKDKKSASIKFVVKLRKQIKSIPDFPYQHRKSIYFEDNNIRDMIFIGYTIIYELDNELIYIITIFNQNVPHIK